jgi:hypothetical protein
VGPVGDSSHAATARRQIRTAASLMTSRGAEVVPV